MSFLPLPYPMDYMSIKVLSPVHKMTPSKIRMKLVKSNTARYPEANNSKVTIILVRKRDGDEKCKLNELRIEAPVCDLVLVRVQLIRLFPNFTIKRIVECQDNID